MKDTILDALDFIFGNGFVDDVSTVMTGMFDAIKTWMNGNFSQYYSMFIGVAASMMMLYFFAKVATEASRDMFTLEKLISLFAKFILGFAIMCALPELVTGIVDIGDAMYRYVADGVSETSNSGYTFGDGGAATFEDGKTDISNELADELGENGGFSDKIAGMMLFIGPFLIGLIINLLSIIAKIIAYLICISNAIQIIVRAMVAPIAVAQMFNNGMDSQGIRYLKKFCALCLTFMCMILVLKATSTLVASFITLGVGQNVVVTQITGHYECVARLFSAKNIAVCLISPLAGIAAMLGASKISNDVLGV